MKEHITNAYYRGYVEKIASYVKKAENAEPVQPDVDPDALLKNTALGSSALIGARAYRDIKGTPPPAAPLTQTGLLTVDTATSPITRTPSQTYRFFNPLDVSRNVPREEAARLTGLRNIFDRVNTLDPQQAGRDISNAVTQDLVTRGLYGEKVRNELNSTNPKLRESAELLARIKTLDSVNKNKRSLSKNISAVEDAVANNEPLDKVINSDAFKKQEAAFAKRVKKDMRKFPGSKVKSRKLGRGIGGVALAALLGAIGAS